MITISSFLFDLLFSFQIFNSAHWKYLADLQLSNEVNRWFYIWIGTMLAATIGTLYFLIVPWHRRIELSSMIPSVVGADIFMSKTTEIVPANAPAMPSDIDFSRPPRLQMTDAFMRVSPAADARFEAAPQTAAPAPAPIVNAMSAAPGAHDKMMMDGISSMLTTAGWVIRPGFNVGGFNLNICAIGSDEKLLIGHVMQAGDEITASTEGDWMNINGLRFPSPTDGIIGAANRLAALFSEFVGDELRISILPFVFSGGRISNLEMVNGAFAGFGVNVFDDMIKLSEFINRHRPRQITENEKEDFAAFSDFIDTVRAHFGS